ncbi:MAG TPA: TonB family protein [Burkholderiales bacterium]|nr:TonB family protein [Burkholderiales bacterium]
MSATLASRGPLWAQPGDLEDKRLPLWRALLIALGLEIILPFLLLGVNWSALNLWKEPPPEPVMSVRLDQPVEEPPPPEPVKKQKPKPEHQVKQVPIVVPKPLPNEVQSKVVLPKLEPKPKPEPKPKEEEKPPEPVPEEKPPEAPPLPSVFRDVKPVKKVKPKYPREAEDAHIEGRVRVRLTVEVNGSVSEAKILLSEPPGVFDAAVMEAVVQYTFKRDGTSYQADQEIIFKLE